MSTAETAENYGEFIGFVDAHPDNPYGCIDATNELEHQLPNEIKELFVALWNTPLGTEAVVEAKTYVLIQHDLPRRQVVSIDCTEKVSRLRGNMRKYHNRSYSLILGDDGILRGESHRFSDFRHHGRLVRQKEEAESVVVLDEDALDLLARFADKVQPD